MDTKPLLYGLSGFLVGGLLVSIVATTIDKPESKTNNMTMSEMSTALVDKTGDDFDKAFMSQMIGHHESAVDMARLAGSRAKHDEIKKLSNEIIAAQEKEISQMKQWQRDWGYGQSSGSQTDMPAGH